MSPKVVMIIYGSAILIGIISGIILNIVHNRRYKKDIELLDLRLQKEKELKTYTGKDEHNYSFHGHKNYILNVDSNAIQQMELYIIEGEQREYYLSCNIDGQDYKTLKLIPFYKEDNT